MPAIPITRHHRPRHWLCCCLLMLGLSGQTAAEVRRYTVVVQNIDYYPIYRADAADNHYTGYMADLLAAFAEHAGLEFSYHPRPVRRMVLEYTTGHYDFALPDSPNWNRSEKEGIAVTYTDPLLTFEDAVYVAAGNVHLTPDSMQDIGTIAGFTPWKFQDRIEAGQVKLKTARKPANLVRMALAGHVDAINLAAPVARHHFDALMVGDRLVPAPGLMETRASHYHLSTIEHPEVIAEFNQFLSNQQALVQSLQQQYGLTPPDPISRSKQ
ncbi:MAG: substrate-binding periplasmic protein [Pseudomonadota bacterium]